MTKKEVTTTEQHTLSDPRNWNTTDIELVKQTICKNSTDDELKLFIGVCQRTQLDPFARQIYAIKRFDKALDREVMSIQVAVDGLRIIAQRSKEYDGQLGPYWCGPDGAWKDVWLENFLPSAAKVGVIRKDWKEPKWAVCLWSEFAQMYFDKNYTKTWVPTPMWKKMPTHMLAKVAESSALRGAFPQELSGMYTEDEMAASDKVSSSEIKDDPSQEPRGNREIAKPPPKGQKSEAVPQEKESPKEPTPNATKAPPNTSAENVKDAEVINDKAEDKPKADTDLKAYAVQGRKLSSGFNVMLATVNEKMGTSVNKCPPERVQEFKEALANAYMEESEEMFNQIAQEDDQLASKLDFEHQIANDIAELTERALAHFQASHRYMQELKKNGASQ